MDSPFKKRFPRFEEAYTEIGKEELLTKMRQAAKETVFEPPVPEDQVSVEIKYRWAKLTVARPASEIADVLSKAVDMTIWLGNQPFPQEDFEKALKEAIGG